MMMQLWYTIFIFYLLMICIALSEDNAQTTEHPSTDVTLVVENAVVKVIENSSLDNSTTETEDSAVDGDCFDETCDCPYYPKGPLVYCSFLPKEFVSCEKPFDLAGNQTAKDISPYGYGCVKWGGQRYGEVEMTSVFCTALPGIECYGNRTFIKTGVPCIKYTGHYFVSTLIYSVLLGFLGVDRFCMGHTGTAIGKLLTLGGFGIWWICDIFLLVTGSLSPADDSNWEPYY